VIQYSYIAEQPKDSPKEFITVVPVNGPAVKVLTFM